jgi:hypothetical protein
MERIAWARVPGTPDFTSGCGRFIAVYERTHSRGFASYRVFRVSLPKYRRTTQNALCVGGLPEFCYWQRNEAREL